MLSIKWITSIGYYLRKCRRPRADAPDDPPPSDDFDLADSYEAIRLGPGVWWGSGTAMLGLVGEVQPAQLEALSRGFAPDGTPLIQNAGAADHQIGWDLTYSAPKSVSVFLSRADSETRLKIQNLHQQAVETANAYLEEVAIFTRRGKGGHRLEHALPIVATFEEPTSNELDPQLHTHCVFLNVAGRADGTTGTILSEPLYRHKLTAGAIYQAELAYLLMTALGLRIEQDKAAFRLAGVPQELVDHYSTRSKQIRELLRTKGFHSAKAAAAAAHDTRKAKSDRPPSLDELLAEWQEINTRFGFTEAKAMRLIGRAKAPSRPPVLKKRIANAVQDILKTESYFSEQQLIRHVAKTVMAEGVCTAEVIGQVRSYLLEASDLVHLTRTAIEPLFTTQEVLDLERELLDTIRQGKKRASHVVRPHIAKRILDKHLPLHDQLTDDERSRNKDQRQAVLQITTAPGQFQVLEGMAGTGKTYALDVARRIWAKAGFRVTGMALSAAAASNLEQGTGIECDTIAMRLTQLDRLGDLLYHHTRQAKRLLQGKQTYAYRGREFTLDSKTIVLVDEAAMVGTRQMAKLITHVKKAGAKLVLVGDRLQLQPIEAGGPFAAIADQVERAELKHVVRQKIEPHDPLTTWHRQAGQLIAAGHVAQAVKLFEERGRLSVLQDRERAMFSLVQDWSVAGISKPTDHVILAATREEIRALNRQCQNARLNAGALADEHVTIADQVFHIGDVVLLTRNARVFGVENGDRGVLLGINRRTKTIALQLERSKKPVHVSYKNYTHLQLAYAMTTHKAQGATVPSVYVLLGGSMQDLHLSYVQTTRASESTRLYIDEQHAGYELRHLFGDMAKKRPKLLAHDVLDSSQSRPGPEPESSTPQPGAPPLAKRIASLKAARPAPQTQTVSEHGNAAEPHPAANAIAAQRPQAGMPQESHTPSREQHTQPPTTADHAATPQTEAPRPDPTTPANGSASPRRDEKGSSRPRKVSPKKPKTQPAPSNDAGGEPMAIAYDPIPVSPPKPPTKRPRRNFADLSHVSITPTTELEQLRAAVIRYGRLPGGIVVEGSAECDVPLRSVAIDPDQPGCLVINGSLLYDSGLTAEEVALLWHAVVETAEAETDFGAVGQADVIGIENDTAVANTLMHADNALGAIVYGYDSMYRLCETTIPNYVNPYVAEAEAAASHVRLDVIGLNRLHDIHPQILLKISGCRFASPAPGILKAQSLAVLAPIGIVKDAAKIISSVSGFACDGPLVAHRFPWVYRAYEAFVAHFHQCAGDIPSVAQSLAYAELVLLLRAAKNARAALADRGCIQRLLGARRSLAIPALNYTERNPRYASVARLTAQRLLERWPADRFDLLLNAVVALRYAANAGDAKTFRIARQIALSCLRHLEGATPNATAPAYQHEISRARLQIEQYLLCIPHDDLIASCLTAATAASATPERRETYLKKAITLCETSDAAQDIPATKCRWHEAKTALEPRHQPERALSLIREQDPSEVQPFYSLNTINLRRFGIGASPTARDVISAIQQQKAALGISRVSAADLAAWNKLESGVSKQHLLWSLQELRRFSVTIEEFLSVYRTNPARPIHKAIAEVMSRRLVDLPESAFFTEYLDRGNLLVASHSLLQSPDSIARMFAAVRHKIESFRSPSADVMDGLRGVVSKLLGNGAKTWWRAYLKLHTKASKDDASKTALLLAHEMNVRGITVYTLYQVMKDHKTTNPQAALFLYDLHHAP